MNPEQNKDDKNAMWYQIGYSPIMNPLIVVFVLHFTFCCFLTHTIFNLLMVQKWIWVIISQIDTSVPVLIKNWVVTVVSVITIIINVLTLSHLLSCNNFIHEWYQLLLIMCYCFILLYKRMCTYVNLTHKKDIADVKVCNVVYVQ